MKISTVIPCHYTASFCAIREDKIKQTYCDGIYGNDSVFIALGYAIKRRDREVCVFTS